MICDNQERRQEIRTRMKEIKRHLHDVLEGDDDGPDLEADERDTLTMEYEAELRDLEAELESMRRGHQ